MAELNQPGMVISIGFLERGEWVFADLNHFIFFELAPSFFRRRKKKRKENKRVYLKPQVVGSTNRQDSLASRCSVKEQRVDGILQSSIGFYEIAS